MKKIYNFGILFSLIFVIAGISGCAEFQDTKTFYDKGDSLVALGQIEFAQIEYQKALKLNPNDPTAHFKMGVTYKILDKRAEAIKEFQETLKVLPNDAGAHHMLGDLYFVEGKKDEAINEYNAALKNGVTYPKLAEVMLMLGHVYFDKKDLHRKYLSNPPPLLKGGEGGLGILIVRACASKYVPARRRG